MKHNASALDFYYSSKAIENLSVFRRVCWKTLKEFNLPAGRQVWIATVCKPWKNNEGKKWPWNGSNIIQQALESLSGFQFHGWFFTPYFMRDYSHLPDRSQLKSWKDFGAGICDIKPLDCLHFLRTEGNASHLISYSCKFFSKPYLNLRTAQHWNNCFDVKNKFKKFGIVTAM